MKNIVITGSTRGIGLATALEFLQAGCNVTLSGRGEALSSEAQAALQPFEGKYIYVPCDVQEKEALQNLWDASESKWESIDIWINNAGQNTQHVFAWETAEPCTANVIHTNLLGMIYGSQIAAMGMLKQGHGAIYSMEGLGSNNMIQPKTILYSTTKHALTFFMKGLAKELEGTGVTAVARADGSLLGKTWYHPWGTIRYSQGTTPTDYAYTGQMQEGEIYFYNARWYDPIIGRFMQADTIVPVLSSSYEQGAEVLDNVILQTDLSNPMAVATSTQWNQSPSQESRYREYLSNLTAPSFDRFGYGYNNPLNFIDPSGHSAIPEDSLLSDILNWAKDNLKLIWRNPPTVLERVLFDQDGLRGTRIFMIDKPAANPPYWHFNSDLRILSPLNHKNIEPLLIGIQTLITKFLTFPGEIFVPIIILPPDFFPPIVPNQITNPQKPIAYLE